MMKSNLLILLGIFTMVLPSNAQHSTKIAPSHNPQKTANIIAENAVLHLISRQFEFTEGPAADNKGNIFFTDQPNNKIWEYDTNGKLSVFMDKAGRSNGMYFDRKGNLITCADEHNQLWSISPDKKITVLLKDFNGLLFNGPNDLWISPDGGIYFTDPYYQRDYWTRKSSEMDGMNVYYFKKGNPPVVVVSDLEKPNGIIGTPDGKFLYVADIKGNKTFRFRVNPDGTLKEKTLFTPMGSDGLTMDNEGNIYLVGKGVTVFNPEGVQIAHIEVPEPWTANVTFGGRNHNVLFMTASHALYSIEMKVKGSR